MKIPILVLGFLLTLSTVSAQLNESNPGANQYYQDAEIALLDFDYRKAIKLFEKSLKANPDLLAAHRALGICYELVNDLPNALKNSKKVLETDSLFSRTLYYDYANVNYKMGNFDTALHYFRAFESLQKQPITIFGARGAREIETESKYLERVPDDIRACMISLDSVKYVSINEINNIGQTINTKGNEYFPFLTNDQEVIFYTRQKTDADDEDLYFSTNRGGDWRVGDPVNDFNTKGNEGMSTLVRDGQKMFFTACNREDIMGHCDIWQAQIDGTDILEVGSLGGFSNSPVWESQAAISCDGSTLFFASNREGGHGGTDLWRTIRLPDGSWSDPVNLGPKINTPKDEEAPFITNDGQMLYFSSTGHKSMGEQDIFMSRMSNNGDWGTPVNLGPPINSPFRELGFFLSADGLTGYFASNRVGGFGGMDIYRFKLPEQLFSNPITFVEGHVKDSIISTPIETTVRIAGRPVVPTDEDGRFFLCVNAGDTLNIRVTHKDYHPYERSFPIPNWDNRSFYQTDILLDPLFSFIKNIEEEKKDSTSEGKELKVAQQYNHTVYFDINKHELSPSESNDLDDFIGEIEDKDIQRVEIIGFTDSSGSDLYNLRLSERRAKKVALYLLESSVIVDQIYMEGKGKGQLNESGGPKAKDRKVEIRIYTLEDY
jgi:tetratricopeptide (TPR) repeat protein